jgi:hypothetical protein
MSAKMYKQTDEKMMLAGEPAVAYQRTIPATDWNPNVPVHATQDEWWEHIHRIEEGKFYTWEEHQKRFNIWKKTFLANHLK